MLTENDASLMTISLISDLDQQFSRASDDSRGRFQLPTSSAVRCIRYADGSGPTIESYLEVDISEAHTLSFHLDVQFNGRRWRVARTIQRDGVESEQVRAFPDLEPIDVESLRGTVLQAATEGFREFEQIAAAELNGRA